MELERHAQLMYTSCGWFFDEISGIETVQIIAYAGRVVQLAKRLFGAEGEAIEPEFVAVLAEAKSNLPDVRDGAEVYRKFAQSPCGSAWSRWGRIMRSARSSATTRRRARCSATT